MTDAGLLEGLLGFVATVGLALGGYALKRASTVDVLASKLDDKNFGHSEHTTQLAVLQARLTDVDGRLYGLHSDLAVLRAQVNGVNGNNGLNGTVKLDQQRIAHLAKELDGIKMAIVRLEMTLEQHVETDNNHK